MSTDARVLSVRESSDAEMSAASQRATGAYTDRELSALAAVGERRTAVALTDIRQLHFSDFGGGRR
jgi:phosphoribosylformylglycinamidine (FGAM) synthase-like enzyme